MSASNIAKVTLEFLKGSEFRTKIDIELTEGEYWLVDHLSDLHNKVHNMASGSESRTNVEAISAALTGILKPKLPDYYQQIVKRFDFSHSGGAEWDYPFSDCIELHSKTGLIEHYLLDKTRNTTILKFVPRRYQITLENGL